MPNPEGKIVILGAGLAGLTAGYELAKIFHDKVLILEKENYCGGLAATLKHNHISFDIGSHRIHPNLPGKIKKYIEALLKEKMLTRKRNSVLYYQGHYLHYPPNLLQLLNSFSPGEISGFLFDYLKTLGRILKRKEAKNFEEAVVNQAGRTLYEKFFRDYASKLWGLDPKEIAPEAQKKRQTVLNLNSFRKIFAYKKHSYFYPRYGPGSIADKLAQAFKNQGGLLFLPVEINKLSLENDHTKEIFYKTKNGENHSVLTKQTISTIPIDDLIRLIPGFDDKCPHLEWRGLRLLLILLEQPLPLKNETFYFCDQNIIFTRVSQIGQYSPFLNPFIKGTFLTVEFFVTAADHIWQMPEAELLEATIKDLIKVNILKPESKINNSFSILWPKAYPVYKKGWKENYLQLYDKLSKIDNLFIIGRGGLFLHSNIDHSIIQGLELSKYLTIYCWPNKKAWNKMLKKFWRFSARD